MNNITLFWTCLDGTKHQIENFNSKEQAAKYALSISNLSSYDIVDFDQYKRESEEAEVIFFKNNRHLNP